MTVPEARKHPVLRRFELRSLRLPLGGDWLRLVVPSAREWLREGSWTEARGEHDEPPYWVEVWPAARIASWALSRHPELGGLSVLDLGCGLGVPGAAAARRGASVTFVDVEAQALAFAGWNAKRVARGGEVEVRRCRWRDFRAARPFDLLVMSDVSYRRSEHGALARLLSRVLRPEGVLLHLDPFRRESEEFLSARLPEAEIWVGSRTAAVRERRIEVRIALAAMGDAGGRLAEAWAERIGARPWRAGVGVAR